MAGGVAANSRIRKDFEREAAKLGVKLYAPPLSLCGDNAAMVGAAGYHMHLLGLHADSSLNAFASDEDAAFA